MCVCVCACACACAWGGGGGGGGRGTHHLRNLGAQGFSRTQLSTPKLSVQGLGFSGVIQG